MNALELILLDRIQSARGWLPFDEFMAVALYEPGHGYYSSGGQVFGQFASDGSDFVTAPELSSAFGATLARQVAQAMRATGTRCIFEFGAGSGALAEQVLGSLTASDEAPDQYFVVELSASLRSRQQHRLQRFGDRVQWLDSLPQFLEGVVLANEVLDAMPVKLLHWDGSSWLERGVRLDTRSDTTRFHWGDEPTPLRPPFDHGRWVPGTVTEIHPHARAWMLTVGAKLARGAMFIIDYGFGDAEYYHPQRVGGTLMCHMLHRADADPLTAIGQKDITAHVNFTATALAGQDAGLHVLGYTSQARFLLNCGITDYLARSSMAERNLALRLLNEHEMGELFKVIGFCCPGQEFEAIGFAEGDRTHRL